MKRKKMDIRKEFIEFFEKRGHSIIESSPLVPDDESLLFTNAGMVQFKNIFTGEIPIPENPRATSSQTCLRAGGKHNDLENVGYTARHHTLFEMLGNFSFGNYFKEDAIKYGWEFVTKVLEFPKEKLWVTIHETDDEAGEIWKKYISPDRIKKFGDKDNFWQMGDTGPCGPSSEIFYDQGEEEFSSSEDYLGGEGDRFLEIWNLVFMQYDRDKDGNLNPLPKPSIDTGMGLERVTAIREGKTTNFHSSIFMPLLEKIGNLIGKKYEPETGGSYRVIADHIRAVSFLLSQGVSFGNSGRGYVLRRILRRAVRHGYLLGFRTPFLHKILETLVSGMEKSYPYLRTEKDRVEIEILREEERFFKTIELGIQLFESEIVNTKDIFSGETAFKLYDTYGFPLDLTEDMLREKGLKLDSETFQKLMKEQRERAKANWQGSGDSSETGDFKELLSEFGENSFCYEKTVLESKVLAVLDENFKRVESAENGWVLFGETPFYAESGGQTGDSGNFGESEILDTKKFHGLNLSKFSGKITVGEIREAKVSNSRKEIAKHHSATHLLHSALREVLGDRVQQAGSLVLEDKLRFDFSHDGAVSSQNLDKVEEIVNRVISRGVSQKTEILSPDEAKERGAMALFGEKYGDEVRVVSFENESMELCGGTHVENSSEIGTCLILKESGVSAGVRRIEAVVGESAYKYLKNLQKERDEAITKMKSQNLIGGIEKLQKTISELKNDISDLQKSSQKSFVVEKIGEINYIVDELQNGDIKGEIDKIKNSHESIAVMLFQKKGNKVLLASGSKNSPVHSGNWIKKVAPILGGGGGGRPDFAQAGGKDISKIIDAKKEAIEFLKNI
jgi:alanyl-tRNA synthetase